MKVKNLVLCSGDDFEVEIFRSDITAVLYEGSILTVGKVLWDRDVAAITIDQHSGKMYNGV